MVTIVDPHIKRDDVFPLHKEATRKGYYVKDAHGKDFDVWFWSGASSYLDIMLNLEIQSLLDKKFSLSNYGGSLPSLYMEYINKPFVFNGPELTMPRDALHYGDVEHHNVHNAYGYYFCMALADDLLRRGGGNNHEHFSSRTQRVGAVWTGDNVVEWDHLKFYVPMVLTLGLTGLVFSSDDVGGFFRNLESELLLRWYHLGAYYPFFRAHAHQVTKRREPWLFRD
ncbi:hypothetical protein SUGI_0408100 [Cryptomeria japonica]|nr:hypothetical protein SUGI_0408100 [Cryptomeria japonica]